MTAHAVVDGRRATGADLALALAARAGHLTAIQVRAGRARGLGLHLERLERATEELYGERLDRALVLDSIALAAGGDASVRVHVVHTDVTHVLVVAGPPVDAPAAPRRVRTAAFQRFLPHVKHGGGFPQAQLAREAARDGCHEVLLTDAEGRISEGSVTNLGCLDGDLLVWPDAPMLPGVTMRLLSQRLPHLRRPLRAADLPGYDAVFLSNSWGVSPVGSVDGVELPQRGFAQVAAHFDALPWEEISDHR